MYIDFIIALIIIVCIIVGDKRGFVKTFIGTFGWIFSAGGAWLLRDPFIEILDKNTSIRSELSVKIIEIIKLQLMKKAADIPQSEDLPGSIASALTRAADRAVSQQAETAAAPIVDALIGVLAFLLVFLALKFILFFIQHILMKFISKGPLSAVDSIGGILCGLLKGSIIGYILVLLTIFIALLGNMPFVTEQVTNSVLIGFLNNFGLTPFSNALSTLLNV